MTTQHRIALLGAGIGAQHFNSYLALPDDFAVKIVCDADPDRGQALADQADGATAVTSIDAAIADDDIDVVDICLPPFLHGEVTAKALAAGKHVICEKPVCGSLAEYDRLADQAEASGRLLLPVFQYRYSVGIQKLAHLVATGIAGRPLVAALETHWNRAAAYYDNPWRGRIATELGGAVASHAIHMHDLLTTCLGPVARVFAHTDTRVNDIETEDCAAISLTMANGALVTHSITLGSADELSRMRFCFAELTVQNAGDAPYDPGAEPWRFLPRGDRNPAELDAALARFKPGPTGFDALFADIATALADPGGVTATGFVAAGRQSIELASAIYYSTASHQEVILPIGPDHPAHTGWHQPTGP